MGSHQSGWFKPVVNDLNQMKVVLPEQHRLAPCPSRWNRFKQVMTDSDEFKRGWPCSDLLRLARLDLIKGFTSLEANQFN